MKLTIFVNNRRFKFDEGERFRTGSAIKARANSDIQYYLLKEQPAKLPDLFIGDCETICLQNGDRFWLVPPCGFARY